MKRDSEYTRTRRLKRRYNITPQDYDDLYIEQEGKCAICGRHQKDLSDSLHVDHNHTTGKIRGLLCYNCNTLLGQCKDNTQILINAIKYLKTTIT